jgi:beta-lactamase class A
VVHLDHPGREKDVTDFVITSAWADEASSFLAGKERETGGRIGLYARNLATGGTLTWRADECFAMRSTLKMSLLVCVLRRVGRGEERFGRARLTGWMLNCQTGAALLRAGLPPDWKAADRPAATARMPAAI